MDDPDAPQRLAAADERGDLYSAPRGAYRCPRHTGDRGRVRRGRLESDESVFIEYGCGCWTVEPLPPGTTTPTAIKAPPGPAVPERLF